MSIDRDEPRNEAPSVVYLAHPLGSREPDRSENIKRAVRWYSYIAHSFPYTAIVADWILTAMVFDETHREQGIRMNLEVLHRLGQWPVPSATELWICGCEQQGSFSADVLAEMGMAVRCGWRVRAYWMLEPPAKPELPERIA